MAPEQQSSSSSSSPPSPQPEITPGPDTDIDADADVDADADWYSCDPEAILSQPKSPAGKEAATAAPSSTTDGDSHIPNPNSSSSNNNAHPHDEDTTHRCFICLTDEPEATLPQADWVTPCGCALEGHQACLLDWIADLEGQGKDAICPLCHGDIELTGERQSPSIQLHQSLGLMVKDWSPAVMLAFLGAGTVAGSAVYGFEALEVFAGPDVAAAFLLRNKPMSPFPPELQRLVPALSLRGGWLAIRALSSVHFGPLCVLPLIGPALVLNHLLFLPRVVTVPVSVLAVAWNSLVDPWTQALSWPPTMQQAFTLLPAIQSSYTILYRRFLGRLEKKWEKMAKRPYTQEQQQQQQQQQHQQQQGAEQNAGAAPALAPARTEAPLPPHPPIPGTEAAAAVQAANNNNPNNPNPNPIPEVALEEAEDDDDGDLPAAAAAPAAAANNRNGLHVEVNGIEMVNFVAGALLWPGVCYGMGALLRLLLPRRLVARPANAGYYWRPTGLLQQRWGRSMVGGCLFVVLKDAFSLYVKYRRAMDRPHRRVRNVDRSKGRGSK